MKKSDEIYTKMYGEGGHITTELAVLYMVELLKETGGAQNASLEQIHDIAKKIDDLLSWPNWVEVCGRPTREEILSLSYHHTCLYPEFDDALVIARMLIARSADKELWQELVDCIDDLEYLYGPGK